MASFKVDENLPTEVTQQLRDAGHDAMLIHDQKMVGVNHLIEFVAKCGHGIE